MKLMIPTAKIEKAAPVKGLLRNKQMCVRFESPSLLPKSLSEQKLSMQEALHTNTVEFSVGLC